MLNDIQGNEIFAECRRVKHNLTQRAFRRLMSRIFSSRPELELVFDLQSGESPKKSMFERMAKYADKGLADALEGAQHFSIADKKRSPKNGTVTYLLTATFDPAGVHHHLRAVLAELEEIAYAFKDVDAEGSKLFAY